MTIQPLLKLILNPSNTDIDPYHGFNRGDARSLDCGLVDEILEMKKIPTQEFFSLVEAANLGYGRAPNLSEDFRSSLIPLKSHSAPASVVLPVWAWWLIGRGSSVGQDPTPDAPGDIEWLLEKAALAGLGWADPIFPPDGSVLNVDLACSIIPPEAWSRLLGKIPDQDLEKIYERDGKSNLSLRWCVENFNRNEHGLRALIDNGWKLSTPINSSVIFSSTTPSTLSFCLENGSDVWAKDPKTGYSVLEFLETLSGSATDKATARGVIKDIKNQNPSGLFSEVNPIFIKMAAGRLEKKRIEFFLKDKIKLGKQASCENIDGQNLFEKITSFFINKEFTKSAGAKMVENLVDFVNNLETFEHSAGATKTLGNTMKGFSKITNKDSLFLTAWILALHYDCDLFASGRAPDLKKWISNRWPDVSQEVFAWSQHFAQNVHGISNALSAFAEASVGGSDSYGIFTRSYSNSAFLSFCRKKTALLPSDHSFWADCATHFLTPSKFGFSLSTHGTDLQYIDFLCGKSLDNLKSKPNDGFWQKTRDELVYYAISRIFSSFLQNIDPAKDLPQIKNCFYELSLAPTSSLLDKLSQTCRRDQAEAVLKSFVGKDLFLFSSELDIGIEGDAPGRARADEKTAFEWLKLSQKSMISETESELDAYLEEVFSLLEAGVIKNQIKTGNPPKNTSRGLRKI